MFCCGHPEEPENEKPKAQGSVRSRKQQSIASTWQIPPPEPKTVPTVKKAAVLKQQPDYELAHLESNCELILFNAKEGSELFLSFAVKKTVVNVSIDSKQNYNSVEEQIYSLLAKRSKDSVTLVITERADEHLIKKYRKYQQAYVMIALIQQPLYYVSKFTTRSKISALHTDTFDEETFDKGYDKKKTFVSMNASALSQPSQIIKDKKERQRYPLDCQPLNHPTQIKLSFFDQIYVYSPMSVYHSMSANSKAWLENIINNIHTLPNLQNLTMILPKQITLEDIMDVLQEIMQEKIKNHPLQIACNMIHFELQCVYSDTHFSKVIIKKRFQEGDLTIMLLAINLMLVEFNSTSQEYYQSMIEQMKKISFKQYMSMKAQMKEGHNSRRTLLKLLSDYRLMPQNQLSQFGTRFAEMKRIADSWGNDEQYTFTVPRDLRVKLSEYLSCRVFIPSGSYHVLSDNMLIQPKTPTQQQQEELIVPSYKQEFLKDKADDFRLSLLHNNVQIDIQINQNDDQPSGFSSSVHKKPSIDDSSLQTARRIISRRKRSNDY